MSDGPDGSDAASESVEGWQRLIALIALPRSGTTVTTAVLGAHSDVYEVYEPWNASKATLDAAEPMSYAEFVERFAPPRADRSTLLLKETMTSAKYLDRLLQVLEEAPATVETTMIVLLRNPFHVFLSECEARRRWWGADDLVADFSTFQKWATRTLQNYRRLAAAAEIRDALCVSYEAFATDPKVAVDLMRALGLTPEDHREDYFTQIDVGRVRGDRNVSDEAEALHARSIESRQAEFEAIRPIIRKAPQFLAIRQISHQIARMQPIVRLASARHLKRVLNGMRADGSGPLLGPENAASRRRAVRPSPGFRSA